jgi:hypothetical protein
VVLTTLLYQLCRKKNYGWKVYIPLLSESSRFIGEILPFLYQKPHSGHSSCKTRAGARFNHASHKTQGMYDIATE